MTDRLTYVVAPNHRIGGAVARRHGVPVRNVIVRPEHLDGMGPGVRILVTAGDSVIDHEMLELLDHKGVTDQEWVS